MPTTSNFGKYVLLRKLASGGMGEVFLAKQRGPSGFEKLLVIKRILSHHLDKPDYVEMFFGEAKLVARLNHHNIIQIYEMGEIQGDHYIAMEYVRGKSLRDIIDELRAEERKLHLAHVIELGIKLSEGLGYAHQARDARNRPMNIVHRDVNPHNVLVSYNGDLKIIDFGIAKSEMASVHTATGTIKGKFVYMSPEQSAADPIDKRSDIFSLGIVLYELACLENPFVRQNVVLSLEAIQRHQIPPPSAKRADASPLDDILAKALAKSAEDRYSSAFELRDALRDLLREGAVRPAHQDLAGLLHELFSADIDRDERQLAEAEAAAASDPPPGDEHRPTSELPRAAPRRLGAFGDEEPTVAGDYQDLAALSRRVSMRQRATDVPTPLPLIANGAARPTSPGSSGPVVVASRSSGPAESSSAPASGPAPLEPKPMPTAPSRALPPVSSSGQVFPDSPRRPSSDAPFDELLARSDDSSGPVPPTRTPVPPSDTEDQLTSPASPWHGAARIALYLAVLVITTVAGFLATRAVLGARGPTVAVVPLPADDPASAGAASTTASSGRAQAGSGPPPRTAGGVVARVGVAPAGEAVGSTNARPVSPPTPVGQAHPRTSKATPTSVVEPPGGRGRRRAVARRPEARPAPASTPASARRARPRRAGARAARAADEGRAPRIGRLTVQASGPAQIRHGARAARRSPVTISVRRDRGVITVTADAVAYEVRLRYRVTDQGLAVRVDTHPWAIVQRNGLSMGRTPQGPTDPAGAHRLTFLKPGQEGPFMVSLRWKPHP